MGEKIKQVTGVPPWVWGIIVPLFITSTGFTIRSSMGAQKMKDDIRTNTVNIERHDRETREALDEKASKEKVDIMYETLIRMEGKMDEMLKKK